MHLASHAALQSLGSSWTAVWIVSTTRLNDTPRAGDADGGRPWNGRRCGHNLALRAKPHSRCSTPPVVRELRDNYDQARAAKMAAMYRGGYTLQAIGDQFGITRERVRQIITKRHGLTATSGGNHLIAENRRKEMLSNKDAKYLLKYGLFGRVDNPPFRWQGVGQIVRGAPVYIQVGTPTCPARHRFCRGRPALCVPVAAMSG